MIKRLRGSADVPGVVRLAKNITVCDFSVEELGAYLELYIDSPTVLALMDDKKRCFSVSSVYRDMITPYVAIMYAWTDPKYPKLTEMEMRMTKDWARSFGISVIRAVVRKNVKGYMKKYGFTPDGFLMKLEV